MKVQLRLSRYEIQDQNKWARGDFGIEANGENGLLITEYPNKQRKVYLGTSEICGVRRELIEGNSLGFECTNTITLC